MPGEIGRAALLHSARHPVLQGLGSAGIQRRQLTQRLIHTGRLGQLLQLLATQRALLPPAIRLILTLARFKFHKTYCKVRK